MQANASRSRRSNLWVKLIAGTQLSALLPAVAFAQAQAEPATPPEPAASPVPAQAANAPDVLVTGTRIRSAISGTANPITVVGPEQIQQAKSVSLEDIVRKQPELDNNGGGVSSNLSNNGTYQETTVGLRNIGAQRTLILLDGRRALNTFGGQSVDLDTIPVAMIERLEILKSGASSIYGADAIGGVVNIITKTDFDGLRMDASAGVSERGDASTFSLSATGGANFDRGNFVFSLGYSRRDPALQSNRAWSSDQFVGTELAGRGPNAGVIPGVIGNNIPSLGGRVYFYGPINQFVVIRPTGSTQFVNALAQRGINAPPGVFFAGPSLGYRYDLSRTTLLISGLEQKSASFNARYEVADGIRFVASASYVNKFSEAQLTPFLANIGLTTAKYPGFYIPPFLEDYTWDNLSATLVRRRVTDAQGNQIPNPGNPFGVTISGSTRFDIPPRHFTVETDTLRARAGFEGTITERFDWEAGASYSRGTNRAATENDINLSRLSQVTGQRPCGADAAAGCSVGRFLGIGGLTPAQIAYFTFTNKRDSEVTQEYVYANVTGPLASLGGGDLAFAIGAEARWEELQYNASEIVKEGDSSFLDNDTNGSYSVKSIYAELNAPLLRDAPLARSLTLNLSGRYDHYSNFGSAATWKAGVDYAITDTLRLRGSYSTSFRAPNLNELFGGRFRDDQEGFDACDVDNGAFAGSSQCVADIARAGLDPNNFRSTLVNLLPIVIGGNRDLRPEKSTNWTAGAVLTPTFIPDLQLSVDYYRIKLRDAIVRFTAEDILEACYGDQNIRCDQVSRNPLNAQLIEVRSVPVNAGRESIEGIDFHLSYGHDLDFLPIGGRLDADVVATWLIDHKRLNAAGAIEDRDGFFDSSVDVEPKWKGALNLAWSADDVRVSWLTHLTSGVRNVDGTARTRGNFAPDHWTHDLSISWEPADYSLTLGIDNVFDKDPPLVIDGLTNSLPTAGYDYVGRFFYAKAGVKF